MIEYMNSLVAMLGVSVVLPVVAVAAASWRRDVAPTSGIAVRARKHTVPATGLVAGTDADAAFGTPQSRGSCW